MTRHKLIGGFRSLPTCVQQEVIRNLVKRYVAAMIRSAKTDEGLTEENFKVSVRGYQDASNYIVAWVFFFYPNVGRYAKRFADQ